MFVCMTLLLLPTAWAQLDSIPITGTAIDTTKVYDGTTTAHIVTASSYMPISHLGNWLPTALCCKPAANTTALHIAKY